MSESNPFLDVLAAAGITIEQFNENTKPGYDRGHEKIKMIVDHLNGPDPGECIWYPWFWKNANANKPSGAGLSLCAAVYGSSVAVVPARLKYKDKKTARYAGETFILEYEEFLLSAK